MSLAPATDFRRGDADLFAEEVTNVETQRRIQAAMGRGLQTRHAEMEFDRIIDEPPT